MDFAPGIPPEVESCVNQLVRTCHAHHVLLSGFAFRMNDKPGDFLCSFGTLDDTYENINGLHDRLFEILKEQQPVKKVLYKNDA